LIQLASPTEFEPVPPPMMGGMRMLILISVAAIAAFVLWTTSVLANGYASR
jgi:hypothetical protein